jgi:hypothetical protein
VASNPLNDWLADVAADAVEVRPGDINAEAQANLWSFSLSPEQAAAVSVDDVVRFVDQVVEARRGWLRDKGAAMVNYWWHDAQAGQLRFSLVSAGHQRLPFGVEVVQVPDVRQIISDWLASPYLHGIPFANLDSEQTDRPEDRPAALAVWSTVLP